MTYMRVEAGVVSSYIGPIRDGCLQRQASGHYITIVISLRKDAERSGF